MLGEGRGVADRLAPDNIQYNVMSGVIFHMQDSYLYIDQSDNSSKRVVAL